MYIFTNLYCTKNYVASVTTLPQQNIYWINLVNISGVLFLMPIYTGSYCVPSVVPLHGYQTGLELDC